MNKNNPVSNNIDKRQKNVLDQVSTLFSPQEKINEPHIIKTESLIPPSQFVQVVDKFLENLREKEHYIYVDHIGEGGMGTVDMVKDKKCLRYIARKTLTRNNIKKENIIRFTEEAQITAQLEHPNIVPVYDFGIDNNGSPYYTMKMVNGQNLKQILIKLKEKDPETLKRFPLTTLLEIFLSVCDAMSYACSYKVVHRDLKPDNIMVGDYGEVYLVDWGLAKVIENTLETSSGETPSWVVKEVYEKENFKKNDVFAEIKKVDSLRTNDKNFDISMNDVLIGTPQYMSPERIAGEASETSEVYALGAILYNILTLKLTVSGNNLEEIVNKIFNDDIKSPLALKNLPHLTHGKVPPGLAAVTMKALSCNIDNRYQRISHLRNEITTWGDGLPTEAEKAGPWLILWSHIKRKKLETSLIITFILLLFSLYTVYFIKLCEDTRNAETSERVALTQKNIAEQETINLLHKTEEVEETIKQLSKLAPKLYDRALYLLKSNQMKEALHIITKATKFDPEKETYFILKGDIEQAVQNFNNSITSYSKALEINPDLTRAKISLGISEKFKNKNNLDYLDYIELHEFMISQKRFSEAAFVLKTLYSISKDIKNTAIEKLANSNLSFVKFNDLELLEKGGFSLNLSNKNVKDISILKGLPFRKLDLSNNPISDISYLTNMPLESIDISRTKISDLSSLSGTPLKVFHANFSPVQSLKHLKNCPLENVSLTKSQITSLEGLNSPYLKELNSSYTKIETLNGVSSSTLQVLNLESSDITDLSALSFAQLKYLNLKNSKIKDINPLKNANITELNISGTNISDFSPLENMPLKVFYANNLKLSKIEFLRGKQLTLFSANKTLISDISPLEGMPLYFLSLAQTKVKELDPIKNAPLENLDLFQTLVKKLPNFSNLKFNSRITLEQSSINDISNLNGKSINYLNLNSSAINTLNGIRYCRLRTLYASNTKIKDLSPLKGKSLNELKISSTLVTDLSPLSNSTIDNIDFSHTKIKDATPLADSSIKYLYANYSLIDNIDFINPLTIEVLEIGHTKIKSLNKISNSNILVLKAPNTLIQDLRPLEKCQNLAELNLYKTPLRSIKPITKLNLRKLIIGECDKVNHITEISKISTLETLIIPTHIKDYSFINHLPNLKNIGYLNSEMNQSVNAFKKKLKVGNRLWNDK